MMRILISPEALSDLKKLRETISIEFGDDTAQNVLKKITDSVRNLGDFPNMGMDVAAKYDVVCDYKYFVANKNYIFYRIDGDTIRIVRIVDARQDFMRILFPVKTTPRETEEYWDE